MKTNYFDIIAGVLLGDTATYLFIICLDYVLRTSIDIMNDNGFKLAKERSRRYPAQTITDANYADDIALLANRPTQAETLRHSLERAATVGTGLHVRADKTEYVCFNQRGDISTLNGSSLKLVDKFIYLGSSVSSTEIDINPRLTKLWKAIDRLSIIWKSDLTDKIKHCFFQGTVMTILLHGCTTWTLLKVWTKSLTATTQECCELYWTRHGGNTRQNSNFTATFHPSRQLSKLDERDMQDTAGEVKTSS